VRLCTVPAVWTLYKWEAVFLLVVNLGNIIQTCWANRSDLVLYFHCALMQEHILLWYTHTHTHTHVCTVCNVTLMSQTHFHPIVKFVMHMIVFCQNQGCSNKVNGAALLELSALEPYIVNTQSGNYNIQSSWEFISLDTRSLGCIVHLT